MKQLIATLSLVLGFVCLYAENISNLIVNGRPYGHMGLYYQGMTGNAPSFADVNATLGYETRRYNGIGLGTSLWAATQIFQSQSGDFSQVKDNFVFSELYASFVNPNRISIYAGRFKTDSEWIKYYTQGAAVTYEDVENLKVDFIWAWKNAYVTHYRMNGFKNPYGSVGALYLGARLKLPDFPVQFTPYIYAAPNDFFSIGLKVLLEVPVETFIFYGRMHFLSFSGKRSKIIDSSQASGDGGFVWFEGGARWQRLDIGGGVISMAKNGARGIDSFGQSSYFERREGLFYNNATSLYGFLKYDIEQYMQLDAAIRHTNIGTKNIFNWEVGVASVIKIDNKDVAKIGIKFIGMVNNADFTLDNSIFANDGKNYLMTRLYGQVNF